MTDPMEVRAPGGVRSPTPARRHEPANLADILERVLDKGIIIAGDIQVNLLDIELLTIKLRLIVASVDRAKEMGIDWWEHDPTLSSHSSELAEENRELRRRVSALEAGDEREPTSRAGLEEGEPTSRAGLEEGEPTSRADPEEGEPTTRAGREEREASGRRRGD
ncbi:gas vesicle protein [Actinomadura rugatobispora]|uniref:Gas vesicle protein GvpJ n=1 Tax=Actinomadura rugatobispora TaxID=1994 RepID=A0ABW1AEV8_9ACTN